MRSYKTQNISQIAQIGSAVAPSDFLQIFTFLNTRLSFTPIL